MLYDGWSGGCGVGGEEGDIMDSMVRVQIESWNRVRDKSHRNRYWWWFLVLTKTVLR